MYEVNIWWHNALSCISQRGNESCRCKTQQPRLDIVDIISLRDDLIAARRCSVAAAQRVDRLCITTSIIDSTPCSDAAWVTSIMLLSLSLSLSLSFKKLHTRNVSLMHVRLSGLPYVSSEHHTLWSNSTFTFCAENNNKIYYYYFFCFFITLGIKDPEGFGKN